MNTLTFDGGYGFSPLYIILIDSSEETYSYLINLSSDHTFLDFEDVDGEIIYWKSALNPDVMYFPIINSKIMWDMGTRAKGSESIPEEIKNNITVNLRKELLKIFE